MKKYRSTDKGKKIQRYYTILGSKKAQLASSWVRKNHPEVWESINKKALKLVGEKPE